MRAVDTIIKKYDGQEQSRCEIDYFVRSFRGGKIVDYQVSTRDSQ